jgi:hypothetical protein
MNKKILFTTLPVLVIFFSSLFASRCPDILETLVINRGIVKQQKEATSIFANYSVPFIENESLSFFCSGLIGLLLLNITYKGMSGVIKCFININKQRGGK